MKTNEAVAAEILTALESAALVPNVTFQDPQLIQENLYQAENQLKEAAVVNVVVVVVVVVVDVQPLE